MNKTERIVLVGGGGHCKVVIDAIRKEGLYSICGITDATLIKGVSILNAKVLGTDDMLLSLYKEGVRHAFITVGSLGDCSVRLSIFEKLKRIGFNLPVVAHPSAVIASDVEIGEGAFIGANVTINPGTKIGKNAIINTRSSIDHDCEIGSFVHIAPGAILSGGVKVKEGAHVGTGAKIIQYLKIGHNAFIAAGNTVTKNVRDDERCRAAAREKNHKVFIIAEAGINHNGDLKTAKDMVDAAAKAGADAVKFQTFIAENIATPSSHKTQYQKKASGKGESQQQMLKRLELDAAAHKELMAYCKKKKIIFLSTPYDIRSIDMLNSLGLNLLKIPSGEITNVPYLRKIGSLKKKLIISTGMATLNEVEDAINILITSGTKKSDIILLHCNTEYPTPLEDVNLLAMITIKETFGVEVGYSDHTQGIAVSAAACALGAVVIEKHFTLSRNFDGPDHKASLEPKELKAMVDTVRNIEKAIGDGRKVPSDSERKNIDIVRKNIVAASFIKRGELFSEENITTKRSSTGISSVNWDGIIGSRSKRDFQKDEIIEL